VRVSRDRKPLPRSVDHAAIGVMSAVLRAASADGGRPVINAMVSAAANRGVHSSRSLVIVV
jgi:hypothetical protein